MPRHYTPEQKAKALAIYREHGPAEASRQTGVLRQSITMWAVRSRRETGETLDTPETGETAVSDTAARRARVKAATEMAQITREERRARLAADLLEDACRLRVQLWERAKVHHWGTKDGEFAGTEFMEHQIDEPTFGDKRSILQSVATAIDKSALLAGESTSKTEVVTVDREAAEKRIAEVQAEWRQRAERKAS